MISRDQADKASDSLLEPSKQELAARQAKLEKRKASTVRHRLSPLFTAAIAAAVALASQDRFSSDMYAFLLGAVVGSLAGLIMRSSHRSEAA